MKIHKNIRHIFDLLSKEQKFTIENFIHEKMKQIVAKELPPKQFGSFTTQLLFSFRKNEGAEDVYYFCEFHYIFNINFIPNENLIKLIDFSFSKNVDFFLDKRAELKERIENSKQLFNEGNIL